MEWGLEFGAWREAAGRKGVAGAKCVCEHFPVQCVGGCGLRVKSTRCQDTLVSSPFYAPHPLRFREIPELSRPGKVSYSWYNVHHFSQVASL